MNFYFEKVSRFEGVEIPAPARKTKYSAGYDMAVAEDTIIPPYADHLLALDHMKSESVGAEPVSLDILATLTKITKAKPTLVSTGYKCHLPDDCYLELSIRSSSPLKYWLILGNSVGIVDSDYYNNKDNEGEIFFQLINLSPFPIKLRKGDIIGQGIVKKYEVLDNDVSGGERVGGFGSTTTLGA